MDASLTNFNKSQLDWNNFACIRYPPPLEQRRSSETDLIKSTDNNFPVVFAVLQLRPTEPSCQRAGTLCSCRSTSAKIKTLPTPQPARGHALKFLHAHHARVRHESRA